MYKLFLGLLALSVIIAVVGITLTRLTKLNKYNIENHTVVASSIAMALSLTVACMGRFSIMLCLGALGVLFVLYLVLFGVVSVRSR